MNPNPATNPNPAKERMRFTPLQSSNTKAAKKKILVVDDDPQIRISLQKVLLAEGYEVVLAADGREGVENFNTEQIDVVLLDLSLPDISGWDVFGTLTSNNPFLPIVIITGRHKQHKLAEEAGVGALIEKPLDVPRLLETVKQLLAEPPEVHLHRLAGRRSGLRYEGRRAGGMI